MLFATHPRFLWLSGGGDTHHPSGTFRWRVPSKPGRGAGKRLYWKVPPCSNIAYDWISSSAIISSASVYATRLACLPSVGLRAPVRWWTGVAGWPFFAKPG